MYILVVIYVTVTLSASVAAARLKAVERTKTRTDFMIQFFEFSLARSLWLELL